MLKYRFDIDGLRAIAVVGVVMFHAAPNWFPGGFVGVDVFFVISGFLISGILFAGLDNGTFDLAAFYGRRIRRIFPALIVVLTTVFIIGCLTLEPEELRRVGKHIAAGAGFVSNFALWKESGYFDSAADAKPLLHLWSLGIEEQFYILWPAILWLARKANVRWLSVVIIGIAVSFAANIWQVHSNEVADFYSPVTRFWELLAGGCLALLSMDGKVFFRNGTANAIAACGLVLLVASIFLVSTERAFPGWWALLPVSGAMLLIAAGEGALINRYMLGNRLMVGIGLISYPLYLWHWPLLSLEKIIEGEEPGLGARAIALLAAIALAWLTYEFIEKPIRMRRPFIGSLYQVMAMLAVAVIGFSAFTTGGYPKRPIMLQPVVKNEGELGHKDFWAYLNDHYFPCQALVDPAGTLQWDTSIRCRQSKADGPVRLIIIGDSHAESLFPGLTEEMSAINVAYYTKAALPLLSDADFALMINHIVADHDIETVVIAAFWHYRIDRNLVPEAPADAAAQLTNVVGELIAAGKRVYIATDVPDFSFTTANCKYDRSFLRQNRCSENRSRFDSQMSAQISMFKEVKRNNPSLHIIETGEVFCDAAVCSMAKDGVLLFRDRNHLSLNGSRVAAHTSGIEQLVSVARHDPADAPHD